MKIAVASMDGTSVSQHFGQSAGFIVFDVEGATIKGSEWRSAKQTPHSSGICGHGGEHGQGHQEHGPHSHAGALSLIGDCKLVVCGGMGAGAAQALLQQGLQPVILPVPGPAQDVLTRFLNGELIPASSATCQCHH